MTRPSFSLKASFGEGVGTSGGAPGMPLPSWLSSAKTSRLIPSGFTIDSFCFRAGAAPGSGLARPRMSRKSDMTPSRGCATPRKRKRNTSSGARSTDIRYSRHIFTLCKRFIEYFREELLGM
eukprot:scaffold327780_cov61-Tisochrysis_lutea.AAC.1